MNLADNLKRIRKENNLSQEQLAEKLGVSRQSVSKWESNQAYPEMDKVLQLCKLFNLNIDELLNQDIREVADNKQTKLNINKYIDDFLDYLTKTIDMFSGISWKQRIKCLLEQFVIGISLAILFAIIGAIGNVIVENLIFFLPDRIYESIYYILADIYIVIALILGIILMLHVFKIRYLDYYIIVKEGPKENSEPNSKEEKIEDNQSKRKIVLEKKREKIIIRDPEHSGYKFISGLLRCFMFSLKVITSFIAIGFCCSFVFFVILLTLSFTFIQTGMMFFGILLIILSCIIINLIILDILYHFIISKKIKKKILAITFIVSLFFIGIGTGIVALCATNFELVDDFTANNYIEEEKIIPMKENTFLHDNYYDIEYIEDNSNDIKLVLQHSKYYKFDVINQDNDSIGFHFYPNNAMDMYRRIIKDFNNKKIINYSNCKVIVYSSKENIEKLKNNKIKYVKNMEQEEKDDLYNQVNELNEKIGEKNIRISELEEELRLYQDNE